MATRIGVRVTVLFLLVLGAVLVVAEVAPLSRAAGQAAFDPVPAGCTVAVGIANTTLTHYPQGDSAGNYTGPGDTGEYRTFICNYGAKRTQPGDDDFAGVAITVDYCADPPAGQNKREEGDYTTFDGEHTVHYKRFLRIGNTTVTMAVYTDERSPGADQFTASEFDTLATNLLDRNRPSCAGGGSDWTGTATVGADTLVAEPKTPITLTATASPTLAGTTLRLGIYIQPSGGALTLVKDCGSVAFCSYAVTSDVEATGAVKAMVVDGDTVKAQSAAITIHFKVAEDWDGTMHFYIGAVGRGDQGVDEVNVKPGVAVPLAVVLDVPVDDTASQILIYDGPDLMTACVSGSTCFVTVNSQAAGTKIYHAKISRPDNTHVQASASVTVMWSAGGSATACSEGWQYTVSAIEGSAAGARLNDAGGDDLGPVTVGQKLCAHQYIKTAAGTTVKVRMPGLQSGRLDTWEFTIKPQSTVNIQPHLKNISGVEGYGVEVEILDGTTGAKSIDSRETDITMHGGVGRAGARGTAFEVSYSAVQQIMTVSVYESVVTVTHDSGSFATATLGAGDRVTLNPNTMSPVVKFTAGFLHHSRMPALAADR